MPVVTIYFDRIYSMLKGEIDRDELLDKIPYLGLDIEEIHESYFKLEYNPNRPDFSTDYGLARALNAFLEFEKSWSDYKITKNDLTIHVDQSIKNVRPYITSAIIKNIILDDESIRQLINMQEDLHNGIGRKRRKVSIGIHNFDVIKPPIYYKTVDKNFSFVPLNSKNKSTIHEILTETDTGKSYGSILSESSLYPILVDSSDGVLSFPPIINGDLTRLTSDTKNLFIDVTSTNLESAHDALAVLTSSLSDAGGHIESVNVNYSDISIVTPDLSNTSMAMDLNYAKSLLGINPTINEVQACLLRSRMKSIVENETLKVMIPRYRFDILHQVDLVEELVIGYGLYNLSPTLPKSSLVGKTNSVQKQLDSIRHTLTGLGFNEVKTFSLISKDLLERTKIPTESSPRIIDTKSNEHEFLRNSLIPSLLSTLSKNINNEYPQKIFEMSESFQKLGTKINEHMNLAMCIAHSSANFTECKSNLVSFLRQYNKIECMTPSKFYPIFIDGRSADILVNDSKVGIIGEISPEIIQSFSLRTPITCFEISLNSKIIST